MAPFVNSLQTPDALHRAVRFMAVGLLGTIIDFSLFAILSSQLGLSMLFANSLSYSAGIFNNYFLHRKWTFADRPRKAAGSQFIQFAGVSLSALAVNSIIVILLAPVFGAMLHDASLAAVLAKLCAVVAGMGWNFLANHFWTFRPAG